LAFRLKFSLKPIHLASIIDKKNRALRVANRGRSLARQLKLHPRRKQSSQASLDGALAAEDEGIGLPSEKKNRENREIRMMKNHLLDIWLLVWNMALMFPNSWDYDPI